jgi:3',5'-cyclic AMP phosphodiesterase CpdA
MERVVKQMKGQPEQIDFCLIVGDLAHRGLPSELVQVRDVFAGLGRPVHTVIGNHDYKGARDRKAYEDLFPGQMNYFFDHKGWQFLGLDSTEGQKYLRSTIQKDTLFWLDRILPRLDKKRPTIVFTHFPLGPLHLTRPTNADQVLNRFKDFNLRAVFNGHHHALTERKIGDIVLTTNRCCSLQRPNHDDSKEKGYFLCHARENKVSYTFVECSKKGTDP